MTAAASFDSVNDSEDDDASMLPAYNYASPPVQSLPSRLPPPPPAIVSSTAAAAAAFMQSNMRRSDSPTSRGDDRSLIASPSPQKRRLDSLPARTPLHKPAASAAALATAASDAPDYALLLVFPAAAHCSEPRKRVLEIPPRFATPADYRRCLLLVMIEQLNATLSDIAALFHKTIAAAAGTPGGGASAPARPQGPQIGSLTAPVCKHGLTKISKVKKEGRNKDRLFYACASTRNRCEFFEWVSGSVCKALRWICYYVHFE
jgi:hypothetical protein